MVPPERIRAIGLGETAARNLALPAGVVLTESESALVARKKASPGNALGNVISDGIKDQRWRTVDVLLNNLITVELNLPATEVTP